MKKFVLTTLALGMAAAAVPAQAAIYLGYSVNNGSVTGVATDAGTGHLFFDGSTGGYSSTVNALGSPILTQPNFATQSLNVQQGANAPSGLLSIFITQTDLTSFAGQLTSAFTSNLLFGSAQSVTMSALLDPANGQFTGLPIRNASFTGVGSNAGSTSVNVPGLFSETVRYDLTFGANTGDGGTFSDTASLSAAVPEPATWAMMLLGFAGIGVATRRRRRAVLAQIA